MAWSLRFLLSLHQAVTKQISNKKPCDSDSRKEKPVPQPILTKPFPVTPSDHKQHFDGSDSCISNNNNSKSSIIILEPVNPETGRSTTDTSVDQDSNHSPHHNHHQPHHEPHESSISITASPSNYPKFVKIVEVGPRDGLQAEKKILSTEAKIEFINHLTQTGVSVIETTSFVNPKLVPQLGDNSHVYSGIRKAHNVSYPVLVPNMKGLERAMASGVKEIAVFTTPSDAFSIRNVNCSSKKSLEICHEVTRTALSHGMKVRAYISCALGCPYEGDMDPVVVAGIAKQVYASGCYEISLGDTIGIGTPASMSRLLEEVLQFVPVEAIAVHCHDTYGQALPNILKALEYGISVFDSSVSGLGGCPFAEGATGNVATEDVVYMLHGMGIRTGVDLDQMIIAGEFICRQLSKETGSKAGKAIVARRKLAQRRASLWQERKFKTRVTSLSSSSTTTTSHEMDQQTKELGK